MPSSPLVSIIIPVYNQEKFLEEAVQSALEQKYPDREIILIDDASTDNSSKALERFACYPRLAIFRNMENMDCAWSFNRGIELSSGKYFAILAADDSWEPDFIRCSVEALEKHPDAAFSYTRVNLMDEKGNKKPRTRDRIKHSEDYYGNDFINIVRWLNPIPHHATMVRRSCLNAVGPYNESLTTTHDWDLWLRLSNLYPVVFIDRRLSNYRMHAQNVTKKRSRLGLKEKFIIQVLENVYRMDNLPETLMLEKDDIFCRAWLDISEAYREIGNYERMRRSLIKALSSSKKLSNYLPYRRMLLSLFWRA